MNKTLNSPLKSWEGNVCNRDENAIVSNRPWSHSYNIQTNNNMITQLGKEPLFDLKNIVSTIKSGQEVDLKPYAIDGIDDDVLSALILLLSKVKQIEWVRNNICYPRSGEEPEAVVVFDVYNNPSASSPEFEILYLTVEPSFNRYYIADYQIVDAKCEQVATARRHRDGWTHNIALAPQKKEAVDPINRLLDEQSNNDVESAQEEKWDDTDIE
jgi:hypothetical protein